MEQEMLQRDWYCIKLGMMALFSFGDLFVNSKAEYEALQVNTLLTDLDQQLYDITDYDRMSQLQITLFGISLLLQASIFSAFILILVDTFPFQVGLLGVVAAPCYYAMSLRSALRLGVDEYTTKEAWMCPPTV
ncbi:hypothetical protein ACHAW6_013981 [Cyclotella cf. meneghiniana]